MALLNFDILPGEGGKESEAIIEQRTARLENQVDVIIKLAVFEIERNLNGQQYKATEETRRAEDRIDEIAKAILSGQTELDELRAACAAWVEASTKAPDVNAELLRAKNEYRYSFIDTGRRPRLEAGCFNGWGRICRGLPVLWGK